MTEEKVMAKLEACNNALDFALLWDRTARSHNMPVIVKLHREASKLGWVKAFFEMAAPGPCFEDFQLMMEVWRKNGN